jgi:hypothetical protein
MNIKTALTAIATTTLISFIPISPALADDGFITAGSSASVVNVRQAPNINSNVVGQSQVGDRVEILDRVIASDGYRWYQVRVYRSEQTGWVRGDLICFQDCVGSESYSSDAIAQILNQISEMRLPDAEAVLRQHGYTQLDDPQPGEQFVTKRYRHAQSDRVVRVDYLNGIVANTQVERPGAAPTPRPDILNFSTRTYAVRIFQQGDQPHMTVFNRQAEQLLVESRPVQVSANQSGTRYLYNNHLIYEVLTDGDRPRLMIRHGESIVISETAQ